MAAALSLMKSSSWLGVGTATVPSGAISGTAIGGCPGTGGPTIGGVVTM
jgi:hypothetical protein